MPGDCLGRFFWSFRHVLISAVIVFALQPVFYGAVVFVDDLVSPSRTWQHIADGFAVGALAESLKKGNILISGGDRYTECIGIGVGLEPDKSRFERGLMASYPDGRGKPCEGLLAGQSDPGAAAWTPYARYWHGYRVYSAPAISALPFVAFRLLNLVLLVLVIFSACRACAALLGGTTALALFAPVLFLSDLWKLFRVTPDAVSVFVIFLSIAMFARALRLGRSDLVLIAIAAISGSVFCFVDLLRTPPWTPMVFAFLTLAGRRPGERRDAGWLAALVVVVWFGGYAATWCAKWVIVYLTNPGFDIVGDVLYESKIRTLGEDGEVVRVPLYSSIRVFGVALASWFLPVLAWLVAGFIRFARPWPIDWRKFWLLASPVLVCIVWFEVVNEHSQTHAAFTCRSAAAAIGVLLAAAVLASETEKVSLRAFLRSLIRPTAAKWRQLEAGSSFADARGRSQERAS